MLHQLLSLLLYDVTKASGWLLITSGPQGVGHSLTHTHIHTQCSVAPQGGDGKAAVPCYIMDNVLRRRVASTGRWCVAQHSRANGQIGAGGGSCWRGGEEVF